MSIAPGEEIRASDVLDKFSKLENGVKMNTANILNLYTQLDLENKAPDSWGLFFDAFSDESKRDPASNVFFDTAAKNINIPPNTKFDWNNKTQTGAKNLNLPSNSGMGVAIKPDGTKLFIAPGYSNPMQIREYTLSTPWNIATASGPTYKYLSPGVSSFPLGGINFSTDGRYFYAVMYGSLYLWKLSTPWVLDSYTYQGYYAFSNCYHYQAVFNDAGTKVYLTTGYAYNLSTPWDLNTISMSSGSPFGLDEGEGNSNFVSNGEYAIEYQYTIYNCNSNQSTVDRYVVRKLSTPYSSNIISTNTFYVNSSATPIGIVFSDDGNNAIVVSKGNANSYSYTNLAQDYGTNRFYKNNKITFQQDLRTARLWITRNYTVRLNPDSAPVGDTVVLNGDQTGKLAQGDTVDIYTADNTTRERRTISSIDYNVTNSGKTTITLDSALTGTYTTSDYIERVDVLPEISMVNSGASESFIAMTYKQSKYDSASGEVEDEYEFTAGSEVHDVVVKLNLSRNDTSLQPYAKMLQVSLMP